MKTCRFFITAICLGLFVSCSTEPDGSRALRTGGPSLEECVDRATGVYFARVENGPDAAHFIVEEVWRHDPVLGSRPAIGTEVPRPGKPRPFGGTRIPDHVVVFRFDPPLERFGGHMTAESDTSVFDGYIPLFDVSISHFRQMVQTAQRQPTKPFELRPVGPSQAMRSPARMGDDPNRTLPRAVRRVPPVYPRELRARGISGEALIDIHILPDGTVGDAQIVRADDILFGQAAEACVRQWIFEPATEQGVPVSSRMQIPIVFTPR